MRLTAESELSICKYILQTVESMHLRQLQKIISISVFKGSVSDGLQVQQHFIEEVSTRKCRKEASDHRRQTSRSPCQRIGFLMNASQYSLVQLVFISVSSVQGLTW